MNNPPMVMDSFTHNAFWLEGRATITFQIEPNVVDTLPAAGASANNENPASTMGSHEGEHTVSCPTFSKASALSALKIDELNSFLSNNGYPQLENLDFTDTCRAPGSEPGSEHGKCMFNSKDAQDRFVPTIISFFKFDPMHMPSQQAASPNGMNAMAGSGSTAPNGKDTMAGDHKTDDPVARLINFINQEQTLDHLKNQLHIPIVSASPTWLFGSTPFIPVGCPLSPPIPVSADARCSTSGGLFPITLPDLPPELERMTGDSVNVIVLDTLPKREDITRALEGAEEHNLLLLDVANNVVMHHNQLPAVVDKPNPSQPKTGKDAKGRNGGGFRMADHGLFVAGIIRDIAPDANVECIRTLNDFCAGDSHAFVQTLEHIHNRMLAVNPDDNNNVGDLYQSPVVINLSCVVPPDDYLLAHGIDPTLVRQDLFNAMQPLADAGAIFVASAGNEGDTRYQLANPSHTRPDALYPAAFAYQAPTGKAPLGNSVIPVGAVTKSGTPASYSCYPGELGIATYGGDVPKHFKLDPTGHFTEAEDIDAMIGIYTSLSYPSLLLEDSQPSYPTPNAHGWAYWSGTSFSTPIVSALVARILQYRLENPAGTLSPTGENIPQALTNIGATQQITWDRLGSGSTSANGQMLQAVQCAPVERQHNHGHEKGERVEVHLTFNE